MGPKPHIPVGRGGHSPDGDDELRSSDEEFATFDPTNPKGRLPISRGTTTSYGKSSSAVLIHAAVEMKRELHKPDGSGASSIGGEVHPGGRFPPHRRPEFWHLEPVNPPLCTSSPY